MTPLVSIILPVYNVENYIAKSIQSVLNQTYINFELLVINDGTPDNSIEVAKQFKDSRIQIFHKRNGGLSDARNSGLESAKGEYVYFMDSDDWIEPNLIEDNLKILEEENLDLVIFGYIQDDEDSKGQVKNSSEVLPPKLKLIKRNDQIPMDIHLLGLMGYAWNKLYRKSFLDKYQFQFEKGTSLVEDILFNAQVYEKINVLIFNNQAFYHYLNRPVQTLIKRFHKNAFELKVKKLQAVDQFLTAWNVIEKDRNNIAGDLVVGGIRYCIHNLFSFKNELSKEEKRSYIKNMLLHPITLKYAKYYKHGSSIDMLYKKLITSKYSRVLSLFAYFVKS